MLSDLADRCEAATGPDRELDGDIAKVMGWTREWVDHGFRKTVEWKRPMDATLPIGTMADPPFYTASLDAAMTLVPEGRDGVLMNVKAESFHVGENDRRHLARLRAPYSGEYVEGRSNFAASLALCAARSSCPRLNQGHNQWWGLAFGRCAFSAALACFAPGRSSVSRPFGSLPLSQGETDGNATALCDVL